MFHLYCVRLCTYTDELNFIEPEHTVRLAIIRIQRPVALMCMNMNILLGLVLWKAVSANGQNICQDLSMGTQDYLRENSTLNIAQRWLDLKPECYIRNASVAEAVRCMSDLKVAFFGDSISRDLGHSLVEFLNNRDFVVMTDAKYDKKFTFAEFEHLCMCRDYADPVTGLEAFRRCKNESCTLGTRHFNRKKGFTWEVTVYVEGSYGGPHSFPNLISLQQRMKYDLMILGNTGLHGINKNIPAYPYVFLHPLLQFQNPLAGGGMKRNRKKKPVVTLPFIYLMPNKHHDELKRPLHKLRRQSYLVDYINAMMHDFSAENNVPYFDTSIVSRHIEASADGLHISQWANLIEIKMLLHFICDEQWQFRKTTAFVPSGPLISSP